jgi:3-dehydroquinate synthase
MSASGTSAPGSGMNGDAAKVADLPAGAVYNQEFTIRYDYPVYFTERVFDCENPVFEHALCRREPGKRHRFAAFIDANVAASWPALAHEIAAYAQTHADTMDVVAQPEVIAAGEHAKNDAGVLTRLQQHLGELAIDRHSYVVAVGGGALLDMVGFAAATTHRGVRHIRIPTTVLAQNDSGVGVKNGVNAFGKKNFLGCFAPPDAVLNDLCFLRTLHPRDRIAGMAEAVKVSLIRDAMFFEWLEANANALREFAPAAVARMIRRCAELHMRQIAHGGDPFERGSGRPLDYGHWSAHKLEALTAHELRHGEAVAIGVVLDTRYSVQTGMLPAGADERVHALFKRLGFHLWHPAMESRDDRGHFLILDGIEEFREHLGGELTVTMLRGIGHGEEINSLDCGQILHAMSWLRRRETGQ